ncbi:acyl-CoA carboxylase epsilon subunit [Nesterenkonia lutea]|uniref:Acyl-CoA carboxylase subunit epsilon n=1 Tax=Nesterenkonia lutea TaxID=272919 RepID=A0ABR9JB13_9MICC|nr:acyl-CoA carboxylase epsilon subunit [Nesterenkonia lutea]MBE1523118.1 hypothetical protein [Nesterenkonia lutea]
MTGAPVNSTDQPRQTGPTDPSDEAESAAQDAAQDVEQDEAPGSDLDLRGAGLADEELAAVTALLGTLSASAEAEDSGAGTAGPADRTLQRRRRLGLWGRPGADSWKHAAGLR